VGRKGKLLLVGTFADSAASEVYVRALFPRCSQLNIFRYIVDGLAERLLKPLQQNKLNPTHLGKVNIPDEIRIASSHDRVLTYRLCIWFMSTPNCPSSAEAVARYTVGSAPLVGGLVVRPFVYGAALMPPRKQSPEGTGTKLPSWSTQDHYW